MKLSLWEKLAGSFFYVGFYAKGPGTVTSLLVFLLAWFASPQLLWMALLLVIPLSFFLAYRFEKCIGHDPAAFTLDEVAGSLIVLCCIPHHILFYGAFFIIWRLLDIFKPFLRKVEQIQQGIGMVLDDVLAATATAGLYYLFVWIDKLTIWS